MATSKIRSRTAFSWNNTAIQRYAYLDRSDRTKFRSTPQPRVPMDLVTSSGDIGSGVREPGVGTEILMTRSLELDPLLGKIKPYVSSWHVLPADIDKAGREIKSVGCIFCESETPLQMLQSGSNWQVNCISGTQRGL